MSQYHPNRQDFNQYMIPIFAPASFIPVRGQGSRLWDQNDKEYIDFAGGIENAISRCHKYLEEKGKDLKIEIEVRGFEELNEVLRVGGVDRA